MLVYACCLSCFYVVCVIAFYCCCWPAAMVKDEKEEAVCRPLDDGRHNPLRLSKNLLPTR